MTDGTLEDAFRQWCEAQEVPEFARGIAGVARQLSTHDEARRKRTRRRSNKVGARREPLWRSNCHSGGEQRLAGGDDDDELVPFGMSNVFGITGPRGSGKSTVASRLSRFLGDAGFALCGPDDWPQAEYDGSWNRLYVVRNPLDCTVPPEGLAEPGAAVLVHLCRSLVRDGLLEEGDLESFRRLIGRYSQVDQAYRELSADLSATPDDFGRYVAEGIESRLGLADDIYEALHGVVSRLGCDAILIKLDDFDLVSGADLRRWYRSLLDELRQPRLLFVLTADYNRLEYLGTDQSRQIDDQTGRHLIGKLLPARNRLSLRELEHAERRAFRPLPSITPPDGSHLGAMVEGRLAGQPPYRTELALLLLPKRPRGAVDLYLKLEPLTRLKSTTKQGTEDDSPGAPSDDALAQLMVDFANCRNESLLARALHDREPHSWLTDLDPLVDSPSVEMWTSSVVAARQRVNQPPPAGEESPARFWEPIELLRPRAQPREDAGQTLFKVRWLDDLARPPDWQNPLRHDEQYRAALRDAAKDDQARWSELLIDRLVADEPIQRTRFLERWRPLRRCHARAGFRVSLSRSDLAALLTTPPYAPVVDDKPSTRVKVESLLPWMRLAPEPTTAQGAGEDRARTSAEARARRRRRLGGPDRVEVDIGWPSLFGALRGAAPPIPYDLLTRVGTSTDRLFDGSEQRLSGRPDPYAAGRLLPGAVWAMVLLADALRRAPWAALSAGWRLWGPLTYVGLAAAYIRTAHVFVLKQCGVTVRWQRDGASNGPKPLRRVLLEQLEHSSAEPLTVWSRSRLHEGLAGFFDGDDASKREWTPASGGDASQDADREPVSKDGDLKPVYEALATFEALPAWKELGRVPWTDLL